MLSTVVVGGAILLATANTLQKAAPMLRLVLLVLVARAGVAHANADMSEPLPGGATLNFNKFLIHEDNAKDANPPSVPDAKLRYFNLAHCVCSQFNDSMAIPDFNEGSFGYEVTVTGTATPPNGDHPAQIWVGSNCTNEVTTQREADCTQVGETGKVADIEAAGSETIEIPTYKFMTPRPADRASGACTPGVLQGSVWLMVDTDGNANKFEYWNVDTFTADSEAPPLPTNFKAVGAEGAVDITWTPPNTTTDVAYYQALCASGENADVAALEKPPAPRYQTPLTLCKANQSLTLTPTDIETKTEPGTPDAASLVLGDALGTQNKDFICGETDSPTAPGMRIEGLKNGTAYTVALLVIDRAGNARGTYFTSKLTPVPATDFWEDLHDQGSKTEGGFCLIAQTFGDDSAVTNTLRSFRDNTLASTALGRLLTDVYYAASFDLHGSVAARIALAIVLLPFVLLALLWHALTLPGLIAIVAMLLLARRRSMRLKLATAGVLMLPMRAHAQTPYWEETSFADTQDELAIGDPERVKWHAGLRLGPYIPGIDAQLGMPTGGADGPYEQMFGGYSILPVVDIERFLYTGFGQAGVGVSLGFMGKKAKAWEADSDPSSPSRPRSEGDSNTFRLFPVTLSAVYRFSYLDDEYGIPLVPYARAGLGYYIWWVRAPNGEFAEACKGGGDDSMCEKTQAAGASLGFVGSIGIAIRAERIDADTARSMRESGIEHAGFYGEYSVGKVDGFGSEKKLSVGDATWFAGVDFEF